MSDLSCLSRGAETCSAQVGSPRRRAFAEGCTGLGQGTDGTASCSWFEAKGTRQWSVRTRHPRDDQVGLGGGVASPRGQGRGPLCPQPFLMRWRPLPSSPVSRVVYNGKRNSSPRPPPSSSEIFTPAHEENVRFIYEAFKPIDLSDLKRRNTPDAKKS
uniref:MAPK regulated corepressor interacting protein 1 n=1 Tax=Suricata suricatta TaxID=37032 RepID=A0A673UKS4_SURSU